MQPFPELMVLHGLDLEADERAVKRAYARDLKKIDPGSDPAGFQSLRQSYEYALGWIRHRDWQRTQPGQAEVSDNADVRSDVPAAVTLSVPEMVNAELDSDENSTQEFVSAQTSNVVATPIALAQEVLGMFLERITVDDAPVLEQLHATLDDPRLVQIEARDLFEWQMATHLANGWRAENRDLLAAAISCFQWDKDAQRLLRFGPVGHHVDRAMTEIAVFEQLDMKTADYQLSLIRRLRSDERPSDKYLVINLYLMETMLRQYPTWLPMVTSRTNIEQWRLWGKPLDWNQELPKIFEEKKPGFHFNTGVNRSLIIFGVWCAFQLLSHAGSWFFNHDVQQRPTQQFQRLGPQNVNDLLTPPTPRELFLRGEDHLFGRERQTLDVSETVRYWTMASNGGDAEAQLRLGMLYYEGKLISRDYTESLRWLLMAAKHGNPVAQNYVARQYDTGLGTAVDKKQAQYWYARSSAAGFTTDRLH